MIYQDSWVNGKMVQKGTRNCSGRYEIIKSFCYDNFHSPFSVLDIGANMCYFGLRLIEDFGCSVIAFEFDHFELRQKNVEANNTKKLIFLKRKLSLNDLEIMSSFARFDLILALSVIHHLPGNTTEWIDKFRALADNVIIEFALEDSTRPAVRKDYNIPKDAILLGHGDSHLKKDFKRPIILLNNK